VSRPSPRLISRSDSSAGSLELEYNLGTCIPRTGSPACEPGAIIPPEPSALRDTTSPVTVSSRTSPVGRQLSLSDNTTADLESLSTPEIETHAIPPTIPENPTPPPIITDSDTVLSESGPITPPPTIVLSESEIETITQPPSLTADIVSSGISLRTSPVPAISLTGGEDAYMLPDMETSVGPTRFLARTHANLTLPLVAANEGVEIVEVGDKNTVVESTPESKGDGSKAHSLERSESRKGRALEFVGKR
jgi:hypothetical protein